MKLIRYVTETGEVRLGTFEPDRPGETRIVMGHLFGRLDLTERWDRIIRLLPPVDPPNVLCVGLNYRGHAEETQLRLPEVPVLFLKANTAVIAAGDPILLPKAGPDRVDYEAELAVVIGKRAKNIKVEEAPDVIFGYTCANDVSARDWQIEKQKKQWARGKSFDTFCPLGPCLVTRDEGLDPNRLRVRALLNGRVLQDGNSSDMIFTIQELVSHLSQSLTLLPGTVILTGTPEGVGFTRQPPVYLSEGDEITIEIEGIGRLTNPVCRE